MALWGQSRPRPTDARLRIDNRSGYVTSDLRRLFARAMRATGCRGSRHFIVVPSPIHSRGCAEIGRGDHAPRGGYAVVIAIAAPSRFSMRRLTRLLEHELAHTRGVEHGQMKEALYHSLGPVPAWARGLTLRHRKYA